MYFIRGKCTLAPQPLSTLCDILEVVHLHELTIIM